MGSQNRVALLWEIFLAEDAALALDGRNEMLGIQKRGRIGA